MIENIRINKYNEETEWRSQREFLNYADSNTCVDNCWIYYNKNFKEVGNRIVEGRCIKTYV